MANQTPTSLPASRCRAAVEDLRSFDWELVDGEDLYADVESLDSFSISSGDGEDSQEIDEHLGIGSDQDRCCDQEVIGRVLGRSVEVSGTDRRDFGFSVGSLLSGGCDDLEDDVVEEACGGGLIDQVGFQVSENPVLESAELSEGVNHGIYGEDEVDIGVIRELRAPISQDVVSSHMLQANYVENHHRQGLLDLDEDEDGDGGYEVDVDDELVPWGVTNRLEKQRMRKLGKRTFAKMNKSKKLAHYYTQRACVHGKHGLGLKAY